MNDFFIMKKVVDQSVLLRGMTIPRIFHELFYEKTGHSLKHGESSFIRALINGAEFEIKVTNEGFDKNKYLNRTDVLQLRYDGNTMFKETLRSCFPGTWNKMTEYYAEYNTYKGFKVPAGEEEYLSIYASDGTLFFECLSDSEYAESVNEIKHMGELQFEIEEDNNAYIEKKPGLLKIRHLSRGVGNSLKELYSYRCQICGEFIGEKYGTCLIHAHHIDYFTKSLNNNPENIMIVCPNHHGIIHKCNPVFNRKSKVFEYQNGYREGLKINKHI